jgi:predicted  nucleic acid-binding Zn-ribbon protein
MLNLSRLGGYMALNRDKIEDKIKELNEIRRIYKRDFEDVAEEFKAGKLSKDHFEKKKERYEKRKEKIRKKIQDFEDKMAALEGK